MLWSMTHGNKKSLIAHVIFQRQCKLLIFKAVFIYHVLSPQVYLNASAMPMIAIITFFASAVNHSILGLIGTLYATRPVAM